MVRFCSVDAQMWACCRRDRNSEHDKQHVVSNTNQVLEHSPRHAASRETQRTYGFSRNSLFAVNNAPARAPRAASDTTPSGSRHSFRAGAAGLRS